ncbi:MAG: YibE/F family protein [Solirubrobacterales bacterium]
MTAPTERAEVIAVSFEACPPPQTGTCGQADIETERGEEAVLPLGEEQFAPDLEVGNQIRVTRVEIPPGAAAPPGAPGAESQAANAAAPSATYNFTDFERRGPMLWLAIAFALLVILFGRLRGALSLVGLALSLAIVVLFIVPAILEGTSPLAVAIVGSLAVMLMTISLAHGLGPKSVAAIVGTSGSLLLVAMLSVIFTGLTNLSGMTGEESVLLQMNGADVSFDGLLIAGMVIGALGVLDDVTVSQASTVLALRSVNPELSFGQLYRRAIDVGRDHVSATVNTLVLAYVGASLPVLLIFGSGQLGLFEAINVELVADQVVAMLVGSIGLIAAVPITTALAAVLARGLSSEELDDASLAHSH